jgi:hypothetical protein
MLNLGFKVAIVSGVMALVFHGDDAERWQVNTDSVAPVMPAVAREATAPKTASVASESTCSSPSLPPNPVNPVLPAATPETPEDLAASSFAAEVRRLSAEADEVDRQWEAYKQACGVRVSHPHDFGREWFALWDRAAAPTVDSPDCAKGLEAVRQSGERIRGDLLRARAIAPLTRGTETGMLRWHALEWPQLDRAPEPHPSLATPTPTSASPRPAEDQPRRTPRNKVAASPGWSRGGRLWASQPWHEVELG